MQNFLWWRDGVIYQIYPRSFFDTNGNGRGDLPGITAKLDYLADLGVDALWFSPFHPSPDKDFGYDISDHKGVDTRYGSLADFDTLVEASHKRGMRVVLDLVLNHTSDQHAWFQESSANRTNPKQDWYIWSDTIPNNWEAVFGGKGWTWHEGRGQYYYHMFVKEQPDVNWRNPDVRAEQLDVVRSWLERGVDGFRLDVFNVYFKDAQLRSNPFKLNGIRAFDRQEHIHDFDQPEMDDLLIELRALLDEYDESYAVGETFYPTREKIYRYNGNDKLHAAFDFEFLWSKYRPEPLLKAIQNWEELSAETGLWPNYVLSNHDVPRTATRHAKGEDDARTKVMMALLLTMRGTPFLYNGEEIGQRDISLKRRELLDPLGKKYYPLHKGRDGCRAPMQWDDTQNAGFTSAKPWLKLHPDYKKRNVEIQQKDENSLFNLTRRLIALRKEYLTLRQGEFVPLENMPKDVLAYLRKDENETILVALNFSSKAQTLSLPDGKWEVLFSEIRQGELIENLALKPDEVLLLKASS